MLKMNTVQIGDATLKVYDDTLEVLGNIDMIRVDEVLIPFFIRLTEQIVEAGLKVVRVNAANLMYVNSSGIKAFSVWIVRQKELLEHKKFRIIFQHDAGLEWQERTFMTLLWLNNEYITLEAVKKTTA